MKRVAIFILACVVMACVAGCDKNEMNNKMAAVDDIDGKRVGVCIGTIHDAFVANRFPRAEIMRFDSIADMALALKSAKIDAALLDTIPAGVVMKRNEDVGILTDDALSTPLGVGFNKKNPVLRERFNNYLKQIKADGTYDAMYRRWIVEDAEKAEMPVFNNAAGGETVVVGVDARNLPFVAEKHGQYVGFDIEMMQRFAEREGMQLKIMNMDFSSLVAALASGKVDLIACDISITEERQKQVDFSDPYMDTKTAVVALKKNLAAYDGKEAAGPPGASFLRRLASSFHDNLILENRYLLIWDGLKNTVAISLAATFSGTLLGGVICFLRMSRNKACRQLAGIYISILRGTPVLVLLMIIFYVVFAAVDINPAIVAAIAFGMNFAAYVSEMFRTGIEGVDKGQTEAGIAMGFSKTQTFFCIVLPQAVRQILPVYKGEFISLVKMTSIVGYIAVQDLTKAGDIIRSRTFDAFFPLLVAAVLYYLIAWLLGLSLGYVELMTDPKARRGRVKSA